RILDFLLITMASSSLALSSPCLNKITSNGLKFPTKFALPTMCGRTRLEKPIIITNAVFSATQIIADNHNPTLWDDHFVFNFSFLDQATSYIKHSETLVKEIKDMFNAMPTYPSSAHDLFQCLSMVDNLQRLGIDRHFRKEIKAALNYVYRHWDERGIGYCREFPNSNLNRTALGFRIFRLNGYDVSAGVLNRFKGENEEFLGPTCQSEGDIKCILNLFRASLVAFPGEKVMEAAKAFSRRYLEEALQHIESFTLSREIEFNLENAGHNSVPALESKNYMDIYGANMSWANKSIFRKKVLELAKLDFNINTKSF
ncbi:hypothetical protein KI387_010604, partial [Taxus chinensis]